MIFFKSYTISTPSFPDETPSLDLQFYPCVKLEETTPNFISSSANLLQPHIADSYYK